MKQQIIENIKPKVINRGSDITIVGISHSVKLILDALKITENISAEVIDLRVANPIDYDSIIKSVNKTGKLLVVDGDWSSCGLSSEIISSVMEKTEINKIKCKPSRITLPECPAPTSKPLEKLYYISPEKISKEIIKMINIETVN